MPAEAAVCWGCRHGHWYMELASQLLVWERGSLMHPTAADWTECKAWLLESQSLGLEGTLEIICSKPSVTGKELSTLWFPGSHCGSLFLQYTILSLTGCPPMRFPGHSDQISFMTNAILLSWSDYQAEVEIHITFLLLSALALQPWRQKAWRASPVLLLSRKTQVKQ